MKKTLSLVLAFFLLLGQTVFAQQENPQNQKPEYDIVKAKKELAEKYADKKKSYLSEEEMNKRTREVEKVLNELAADIAAGKKTKEDAKNILEKMEVYILEEPEQNDISILSTGTDLTLNPVMMTFDSNTSRWTLTGGGYWKNDNWFYDKTGVWWGYVGETKNMGGVDSIGITLFNTGGSYKTSVVSSLGSVTDHNGWTVYMYNPSHGDGKYGVAFDYQDKIKLTKVDSFGPYDSSDFTYFGSGFAASVSYDSNFVYYNGYARTMYAHTWDTTTINNIGFSGSGGQYGVTVNFSTSSNKFLIFNNYDTTF
ncbi:hypothetical protein [Paenibacillus caui]|uniref:hypothetical protein n=1 Tax=Paenibacillus caui TaxID=2873927 RepID=UPI001CAA2827|nr:hypothetical protein [Paenibacillus caui]